jgi:phenylacetic acid degradation operon negative regulatory protein
LVAKCWNLPALNKKYRAFNERWRPRLEASRRDLAGTGVIAKTSFALRFRLIHEFRRFLMEDPYLPRTLLPDDWAGDEASRLFYDLHEILAPPADSYVDSVLEVAPNRQLTGSAS